MLSPFFRESAHRTVVRLALGVVAVQCFGFCSPFQVDAWAQGSVAGTPDNQGLQTATEAQVKDLWSKLQADSSELEATDSRATITRYQQFFEQGAGRFPSVGVQVALRIARLWQLDLGNYDKAIEIYDWALGLYKNQPTAVLLQLQQGRLAAEQAQQKAERVQKNKGALPPGGPGSAPLTVGIPQLPTREKLGVGAPAMNSPKVTPFTVPQSPTAEKLEVGAPATNSSRVTPFTVPRLALRGNALGWRPGEDRCVTALTQQQGGTLWVATEDSGVWRYNPSATHSQDRWQQFTTKEGLGDESAYALAVDKQNRVWVGTQSHGVSVWNGKAWKNYGVLEGPIGEHIFAIKVCPTDGDVWMATNAGLSRYSSKNDTWSTLTRGDGLPSNQVQALAFDKAGNVVIGTQCDGVALAQAADGYKTWSQVKGPEQMPVTPTGKGLPSSLINDVLIAKNGTIYVATKVGLAWSSDQGANWSYVRGQDYAAKVQGRYNGPPPGWAEAPGALLAEDYVSCLAEDSTGGLWLGHWRTGDEKVDVQSGSSVHIKGVVAQEGKGFIKAILPVSGASLGTNLSPLIALYDEGVAQSSIGTAKSNSVGSVALVQSKNPPAQEEGGLAYPVFPRVAAAPTINEIRRLSKKVGASTDSFQPGDAAFVSEDWRTRGDWLGRYGRYYSTLCAVQAPFDDTFPTLIPLPEVVPQLGPHIQGDDSLRRWIHWLKTDDERTLYNPSLHYRRQAEWDDHGETYPLTFEGPDIWSSLEVPPGTWRITSYFFNKDGHGPDNANRDYLLELRHEITLLPPYPAPKDGEEVTGEWLKTHFGAYYAERGKIIAQAQKTAPLATARVRDFWGGVHESFVVQGPATYWLRVARNGSFNTITSSVMWDEITPGKDWGKPPSSGWMGGLFNPPAPDAPKPVDPFLLDKILTGDYHEPAAPTEADNKSAEVVAAARDLWAATDAATDKRGSADLQWLARLTAYRAAQANGAPDVLLENWRWKMALWSESDRSEWKDATMRFAASYAARP
jgi:sugar lactone lactonase YvrE